MSQHSQVNIPVQVAPTGAPGAPTQQGGRTIRGSIPVPTLPSQEPGTRVVETRRNAVTRLLQGTPGRMRLAGILGVIASLLIGASISLAALASSSSADKAAANTAQVARITSIHGELLKADALATNAFLVAGAEPADRRAAYDTAISSALTGITQASAAQPADTQALTALAQDVETYTSLVDQARSYNRMGLPVGAGYVTQASAGLRADAIPVLTALETANRGRATAEMSTVDTRWVLIPAIVGLAILVLVMMWLARRTRRYLNGPMLAAFGMLAAATAVVAVTLSSDVSATASVQRTSYATSLEYANMSIAAQDARANESLTLIKRGSGKANEAAWASASTQVLTLADQSQASDLTAAWQKYADGHKAMRALDDGGQWDKAVAEVTGDGDLRKNFDAAVDLITAGDERAAKEARDALTGVGVGYLLPTLIALGATIIGAWLIVRGLGRRIGEYR